jgi:hypothetical protein
MDSAITARRVKIAAAGIWNKHLKTILNHPWKETRRSLLILLPGSVGSTNDLCRLTCITTLGKGKAVPLQAWTGPQGSRRLRPPDFLTSAHEGGKIVSLTHRPPLPPGLTWYSFFFEAESAPWHCQMPWKKPRRYRESITRPFDL